MNTNITVREYTESDIPAMIDIWNEVVLEGVAFPQEECLTHESGKKFFAAQSRCGVALDNESSKILGLYILHPNNVGRCGHIANASYAVSSESRGLHIGEKLVCDCLNSAKALGFKIMQFNAVVAGNIHARRLYERLGFNLLGTIPGGFHTDIGFEDICVYYKTL